MHLTRARELTSRLLGGAMAVVLAAGLSTSAAFADDNSTAVAKSADNQVIAAAYAAAEPAPELLGLNNPNFRNTGEADNIGVMFGDDDVNEAVDPFVYNYMNGLTPGIAIGGRSGAGPMAALDTYDATDSTAAQNAVWAYQPQIVLGTGSDTIPDNESKYYIDNGAATAVEDALGLDAGSYNPIGVTYNRTSLPTMIQTMYRLAEAADTAMKNDSSLTTRYEDPLTIAKDYERYILGQKGLVKQAIDSDSVDEKTIALVQSYDSDAKTYTIITDGVPEGTATTNRYLEAVQGVTKNYYDSAENKTTIEQAGQRGQTTTVEAATVTADELKNNVDVIIVGGNAGDGTGTLTSYLSDDGLLGKTFYCTDWGQGSVFGTTVNSVENAQNVGRILPCVYSEVLDQSDMVAYYYDTFYHIKDGKIADMVAEQMDGVRNWNNTDSASYTNWETTDVDGYDHDAVEAKLVAGVGYLNQQSGLSEYLTPSSYVESDEYDNSLGLYKTATSVTVGAATDGSIAKTYGDAPFSLNAQVAEGDGVLTYTSSNKDVATVDSNGVVTIVGAGTATITVHAKPSDTYASADTTATLNVGKKSISDDDVTLDGDSFAYDGSAQTPGVTVTLDGTKLTEDTDYTVSYANNEGVGTAKVTVTGTGNYTGTVTKTFKIAAYSLAKAKVTLSKTSYTYNGKAQKPSVKSVTLNGKTLKSGTDYTVSYKSNTNVGTATVTVTGKGNYAGTATATFKIAKAANTITVKAKTATVKYAKVKKAKQTLKVSKVLTVSKAKGTKTYAKVKGNKKITIAKKTGKVTVKKGLKKGTYSVKVKVKAAGNGNYKAKTVTKTFKIKVA